MTSNMCGADRILRLLTGVAMLAAALLLPALAEPLLVQVAVAGFGAVNLLSAAMSYCPVYQLAGLSSIRRAASDVAPLKT